MSNGRKFRGTRRSPSSERSFFEQKLSGRNTRTLDRLDLMNLVRGGEDTHLEFKIRLVNVEKITAEIVAMANSSGGAILFGVTDQRRVEGLDDPEQVEEQLIDICRNQIKPALLPRIDKVAFDNGSRVVVLQVDDRRAPHATPDHRYFVRVGSTKREADSSELAALFSRSRVASFDDMPVSGATIDSIDEALVWSYVRDLEGETFREPEGFPTAAVLRDLGLVAESPVTMVPTLAGLLLFGNNAAIAERLPQSSLSLLRVSGSHADSPLIEQVKVCGNLDWLYERATSFIKRYVDLWEARPPRLGTQAGTPEPVPARRNYPHSAVAEALTNLLVHRDYAMVGSAARVLIFDDRIEFSNPARALGMTRKSIDYGRAMQLNPRLHHVFTQPEYGVEPTTRGIPALRRAHHSFTRREPRISAANDEFRVELIGA